MKKFSIIMGLLIFLAAGLAGLIWLNVFSSKNGPEKNFIVNKGENFVHVAWRLESEGIIRSSRAFRWYVNFLGLQRGPKRGEYALKVGMSVPEVFTKLSEGKFIEYKFTIPEGHNLFQVAERLEASGLIKSAKDFVTAAKSPEMIAMLPTVAAGAGGPPNVDGYLYPDTYILQKIYSEKEILQIMISRFREVYKTVAKQIESTKHLQDLKLSPSDVITLASIVEKETGAAAERPMIASIFLNRLRLNMRLQSDPTTIYGIWYRDGEFSGKIHKSDLLTTTPYNTYTIPRLPIGPIANPGINAIQAVLNPATSEYLYFVSNNDGTHHFSKTYGEHSKAVQKLQVDPGAREGKSWRDLPQAQRVVN